MKRYIRSSQQFQYIYMGPVWRFSKHEQPQISDWYAKTVAVSPAKAISNIKSQARKALKLKPDAKITINEADVTCITPADTQTDVQTTCPNCGSLLNDAGECLVCDLGVEDYES